jgi:hypothetical protein
MMDGSVLRAGDRACRIAPYAAFRGTASTPMSRQSFLLVRRGPAGGRTTIGRFETRLRCAPGDLVPAMVQDISGAFLGPDVYRIVDREPAAAPDAGLLVVERYEARTVQPADPLTWPEGNAAPGASSQNS